MRATGLEKFRAAVEGFCNKGPGLWCAPSTEFKHWLRSERLPAWLERHLLSACLARTTHVGLAYFYSPARIRRENRAYPEIKKAGFFQIGSAFDGDPVVVQFQGNRRSVGYLSSDALWRDREDREVEFLQVAESLGDYAAMAKNIDGCPIDFYGTMPERVAQPGCSSGRADCVHVAFGRPLSARH
jgi:hypothetical protein